MFSLLYGPSEDVFISRLSYLMVVSGLSSCIVLLTGIQAMYGRYTVASSISIPSRIAWTLQEAPAFLIALSYLFQCTSFTNAIVGFLFVMHYFVRTFIFPYLMKSNKTTPWYIFLSAVLFCTWNGYIQGAYHSKYAVYETGYLGRTTSLIGIFLFFIGFVINQHSDHVLRNLRKPGETTYKIPRGGLFEYVSGANFFGEIVEWFGFFLLARSLPSFAFALFTICNIGPRALQHHKWYLTKFNDYPKNRKALIPFVL